MFFDNVSGLLRVLVVGPLAYVWLIAVLRCSGKRTLAQLNAFDFIVTVALGSTLATVALSSSVAWSEGALALGLLAALQFVVAWGSVHVAWVRGAVTSAPTVLLRDGQLDLAALARQRITEESLRQAVRSAGIGGLELVSAVVLECDASRTMRAVPPKRDRADGDQPPRPRPPLDAVQLLAHDDGFLTWIEQSDLIEVAVDEGALLSLDVYPGSFLVKGTPLGAAWPASGGRFDKETANRVAGMVAGCMHTGFERTASQDVGYGLRQLADVANKALSPGINDPTTAIHALGHISAFLCDLTDHDLGPQLLRDEEDRVRVTMNRPDLAGYLDLGISQPRRYGAADPQVLEKIFQVLLDLTHRAAPEQRPVVRDQLERLRGTVAAQSFDSEERTALAELGQRIEENLRRPLA